MSSIPLQKHFKTDLFQSKRKITLNKPINFSDNLLKCLFLESKKKFQKDRKTTFNKSDNLIFPKHVT